MRSLPAVLALAVCVPLTSSADVLRYSAPPRDGGTRMTLVRTGGALELRDGERVVARGAVGSVRRVDVRGADGAHDDTLVVDLSGGPIPLTEGIDYDGGEGGFDTLELRGGSVAREAHTLRNAHDGVITLDRLEIRYRNLEPITDTVPAASFTINATSGFDTINIVDGPVVTGFQTTQVNSGAGGTFELVNFANKTAVTVDGQGGGDAVTWNNPAIAAGLTTMIVQNVGSVSASSVGVPNVGIAADGNVVVGGVVSHFEATSVSGGVQISSVAGLLTIGGVTPSLMGIHASGLVYAYSFGTMVLDDSDGPEVVRSESGDISFATEGPGAGVTVSSLNQAAVAPHGSISVIGGLWLGTTGGANDFRANGSVHDIGGAVVIDGGSRLAADDFGGNTGESVTISTGDFSVVDTHGGTAAAGVGGTGTFLVQAYGTVTIGSPRPDALFVTSGSVQLQAQHLAIGATSGITAGGYVLLQPALATGSVDLGSTSDASPTALELSNAELARVFTPDLRVGRLDLGGPVTATAPMTGSSWPAITLLVGPGGVAGSGAGSLAAPQSVTVEDGSTTAHTWAVTGASVTESGSAALLAAAPTIAVIGGTGADTFLVTPSPTVTLSLTGGDPAPPASPGDQLVLDLAGTLGASLSQTLAADGYTGTWSFSNRAPVRFAQMETVPAAPAAPPANVPTLPAWGFAAMGAVLAGAGALLARKS